MRIVWSLLLVLVLVPEGSRPVHRPVLGRIADVRATPVSLDRDPRVRRVGNLVWLGGIKLSSHDPAFGGFSSLSVAGNRFTLLSDGGNIVRFTLRPDWTLQDASFGDLPGGPGTGWTKRSRDSESMSVDPRTGDIWVGFENYNALWRYAPGFTRAKAHVRPPAMRKWGENSGPEAMTLLPGGGMATIDETDPWPHARGRGGIVFYGDPVLHPRSGFRFNYLPPEGYNPSDMTVLPDGRWLILNRGFAWARFSNVLTVIDPAHVRPGATVRGHDIATLAAPLIHDNFEGVTTTQEKGATIIWLVSDDNQLPVQRSMLLKFRLDPVPPKRNRTK
ncbi:esterase-like activity of phytase family protein [Sphingomonas sp. MMS24-J45]|uniref:esterase-like activity of phytase family protein n=1 Tax=Sphingomonas sp. MMS24-J45 TaxID=3238806 RepID=UPI0038505AAD